jgi:hypothetical protein
MNKNPEILNYLPGTCNIGPEEIKRRRDGVIFSAIGTIVLTCILVVIHANPLWRLSLFLPLTSLGISFQQWYYKFCVYFGMRGVYNFKKMGSTTNIEDGTMRKADRAKAGRMIITSIIFASLVTLIFCFIPLSK